MMMKPLHAQSSIAVIGGSLIGPLMALLLEQAGFENVHVYEAMPEAIAVSQAGGIIGLDWLSLDVLDRAGIGKEEIFPNGRLEPFSIKLADRREVARKKTLYAGTNTTWTLLHNALIKRLSNVHMGKRLTMIAEGKNGAVLQFADGTLAESDFVIGADGRKSTLRKLLDPSRELNYAGYVAIRGQLSFCPEEISHFVWYEVLGRKMFNICPVVLPSGEIGADWTLFATIDTKRFQEWFGAHPTVRTFAFPDMWKEAAHQEVEKIAATILPEGVVQLIQGTRAKWAAPIVDTAPPAQMVYRVGTTHTLLVGDALSPVQPHTAKGANHGISQVFGLAQILRQHHKHGLSLEAGLADWQRRWIPQVAATLELGRDLAQRFGFGAQQPE